MKRIIVGISREHLEVVLATTTADQRPGFADVHLVHRSLPEFSLAEVDTGTTFLGHELQAPVIIAGMTGGHDQAVQINARLGAAAQRLGLGIGVGSQRAAIEDPPLEASYTVVREAAPTALVLANLGMSQLVAQGGSAALAVHLNLVEEMVQTEGDRNTTGIVHVLQDVVAGCPVPVVATETGSGVSRETCEVLAGLGVAAIDVGGTGGTDFAGVEAARAQQAGDNRGVRLGCDVRGVGDPHRRLGAGGTVIFAADRGDRRRAHRPGRRQGVRPRRRSGGAGQAGAGGGGGGAGPTAALAGVVPRRAAGRDAAVRGATSRRPRQPEPVLHGRTGEWAHQRALR